MALLITTSANTQSMALSDIVKEICQRVNDPFEDNFKDRARELFVASSFQMIADAKWTRFDYHGLIGSIEFHTGDGTGTTVGDKKEYVLLGLDNDVEEDKYIVSVLDIVSKDISEASAATRKFVPIDTSEANRIATDVELEPIIGEVYWYMVGRKLFFHTNPQESMENLNFIIEYMVNPQTFTESENMLDFYSVGYIYEAIDVATGKLLAEIGLA